MTREQNQKVCEEIDRLEVEGKGILNRFGPDIWHGQTVLCDQDSTNRVLAFLTRCLAVIDTIGGSATQWRSVLTPQRPDVNSIRQIIGVMHGLKGSVENGILSEMASRLDGESMPQNDSQYNVMQVCLNGHVITAELNIFPEESRKHCKDCGAKTIKACMKCKANIRGADTYGRYSLPMHCDVCGHSYPWAEREPTGTNADPPAIKKIEKLLERFHYIVTQMRLRSRSSATWQISDEYDVQKVIHALLLLDFDDVQPEECTQSCAGASSRVDFLIKSEKIGIEVKKTRIGLAAKQIGDQLLIDCQRYRVHPDCKTLVCFVYDPDHLISNPRSLEQDLVKAGGELPVRVYIRPR